MSTAYERAAARSAGKPVPPKVVDLVAASEETVPVGSNGGPPIDDLAPAMAPTAFDLVVTKINDLYDEAKNWADGEPISSAEIAAAVTELYDGLHEAGKEAEVLRVAEKAPLDKQIDDIQARFNPYVQPKKGKVALGKESLGVLLTAWRVKEAKVKEEKATAARKEADELAAAAQLAMQASSGNLEARERAEEAVDMAKEATKFAKRTEKAATTGTGLRTVWVATITDEGAALDWAYTRSPARFLELVQSMADEVVRSGVRDVPGFAVNEEKKAA